MPSTSSGYLMATFAYPEPLQALARTLDVPVKEFFEFEHLEGQMVNVKTIQDLLEGAGEEKLRLAFLLFSATLLYGLQISNPFSRESIASFFVAKPATKYSLETATDTAYIFSFGTSLRGSPVE
jgi:hypothetical protein